MRTGFTERAERTGNFAGIRVEGINNGGFMMCDVDSCGFTQLLICFHGD